MKQKPVITPSGGIQVHRALPSSDRSAIRAGPHFPLWFSHASARVPPPGFALYRQIAPDTGAVKEQSADWEQKSRDCPCSNLLSTKKL